MEACVLTIVAFGCSQTYGHGLPDCIDPNDDSRAAPLPSRLAWPALIEATNLAQPGGSNKLCVYRALQFEWKPNDIAVFAWTFTDRSTLLPDKRREKVTNLGTWQSPDKKVKSWRQFVATANNKDNFIWDNVLYVDYMKLRLPCKSFHFTIDKDLIEVYKFDGPCLHDFKVDNALDGMHYGERTHFAIADYISKTIASG